MRNLTSTYIIIASLAVFAIVVGIIQFQSYQRLTNPQNYQECTVAPGAIIQESYPEVCRTPNGASFTRPLSPEEEARLYPPTPTPTPTLTPWSTFSNSAISIDYPPEWQINTNTTNKISITEVPSSSTAAILDIAINTSQAVPKVISAPCTTELASEPTTFNVVLSGTVTIYLIGEPLGNQECGGTLQQIIHFATTNDQNQTIQVALTYFQGGSISQSDIDRIFESIILNPSPTAATSSLKECIITGCSSQICADEDIATTCEYREEYACYVGATCERQKDGRCGWTENKELTQCLSQFVPANL